MKATRIFLLVWGLFILSFSSLVYGGVPQMINYQGKLTTPAGALVDTTVEMIFTIYDAATDGGVLWADTQSAVVVEKGVFSTLLGSTNPIPDSVFEGSVRYLGVKVGTDPEMTPRKEIVSVGYAYKAEYADTAHYAEAAATGIVSVDGVSNPGGDVDLAQAGAITITPNDAANTITVGETHSSKTNNPHAVTAAQVGAMSGSGTTNWIPKFTGSTTLGNSAIYETGSRIGIGTTTPISGSKLHVQHDNLYAGYFTSNYSDNSTRVIYSKFTGSGDYDAKAVYGYSRPADYYGYGGFFEGGKMGVFGLVYPTGSEEYYGVHGYVYSGSGTNYGLFGCAWGDSSTNYGVFGYVGGTGTNWAGYFYGNARVTGTLTKGGGSFQIDHPLDPENKYLFHSFVESPDMMNVYNGNVILDANGEATVELPAYFEALNRDFRYQLTCIGGFAPVYIAEEISTNRFTIAGGEPGMKVSWQVTGIRHDKFAEANRIQVEVDKPADEQGKYLHPQAYNLGEEYDIHYEQNKRMKERLEKEKMD